MSKSSTVTVRETPVAPVASASVGSLTIHGETFLIETDQRVELVDLTNRIMEFARKFKIREGLISLWSMHTTCAVFINEFQTALLTDIKAFLEKMVDRDEEWLHNNPDHSDCDRMNADAHLRALLLGHSLTLQISGRGSRAGTWQRILMASSTAPHARSESDFRHLVARKVRRAGLSPASPRAVESGHTECLSRPGSTGRTL